MCSRITSLTFGSLPQIHLGTRRSGWISEDTHKSLSNLQSLAVIRNSPHSPRESPIQFLLLIFSPPSRWISALSQPTKQVVWKRNRNAHRSALRDMLERCDDHNKRASCPIPTFHLLGQYERLTDAVEYCERLVTQTIKAAPTSQGTS